MSWILSQPVIVGIAVMGGLVSVVVMLLQARGNARREWLDKLNRVAYLLMGISVVLFIVSGFVKPWMAAP